VGAFQPTALKVGREPIELDQAKIILRSLADGRDPATGEQFPPNSPYQQVDTVRALFIAVDALVNASRRARAAS